MLMSEWIRENLVEPAKEKQRSRIEMRRKEAREAARAELIEEIREWDRRRRAAQQRGDSFDEQPPHLQDGA